MSEVLSEALLKKLRSSPNNESEHRLFQQRPCVRRKYGR
jgi:hypothetical protein